MDESQDTIKVPGTLIKIRAFALAEPVQFLQMEDEV